MALAPQTSALIVMPQMGSLQLMPLVIGPIRPKQIITVAMPLRCKSPMTMAMSKLK